MVKDLMRCPARADLIRGLALAVVVDLLAPDCTQRIGARAGGIAPAGVAGQSGADGGSPSGGHAGSRTFPRGGATGAGATGSAGVGGATSPCTFMLGLSTRSRISTVGIVTFSTTLTSMNAAHIDFGLDTSYGMTAPVDLRQPSYRTLLLGMKPARTYHFRIVASDENGSCVSDDNTIQTGAVPAGLLPPLTVTTYDRPRLYGGFLVLTQYQATATASGTPVAVIDADGDYVWWYPDMLTEAAGARLTADGASMWINSANVPGGAAQVHKITMDGATDADFSIPFAGAHHQIAPLPDGSVAFCAYDAATGCDDIKLFPPTERPTATR